MRPQILKSLVSLESVRSFAPEESGLILYGPPFRTIRDDIDSGGGLSAEQHAVHDIVPELTVVIADFGLGSDTAVALDYRDGTREPRVIRMQWRLPDMPNRWVPVAQDFESFWKMLDVIA